MKEISVGKSDLVSAKNRRESAKNLVFGRMGIFLAGFLAGWGRFLAFWNTFLVLIFFSLPFSIPFPAQSFQKHPQMHSHNSLSSWLSQPMLTSDSIPGCPLAQ